MNRWCIRSTLRSLLLTGLLLAALPFVVPGGICAFSPAQAREVPSQPGASNAIPVGAVADLPVQAREDIADLFGRLHEAFDATLAELKSEGHFKG